MRRGVLLAPILFIAHWGEESSGFVRWFNAHAAPAITQSTFEGVNLAALLITIVLAGVLRASRSAAAMLLMVGWLSFLMLANAIFHLTGAVLDRDYVPGLLTALVLYLPFSAWWAIQVGHTRQVPPGRVAAAALLGAIPMAVHGYRIRFLGSRLF